MSALADEIRAAKAAFAPVAVVVPLVEAYKAALEVYTTQKDCHHRGIVCMKIRFRMISDMCLVLRAQRRVSRMG